MSFDFLPDKKENPVSNNEAGFSTFDIKQNIEFSFYDNFKNHVELNKIFPIGKELNESYFLNKINYTIVRDTVFEIEKIKNYTKENWYGDNTDFETLVNKGYTQFCDIELLKKVLEKLENKLPENLISKVSKPKININDRFGLFSFDLASSSMFFVYEYYNSNNEKVDSNFVKKINEKYIFEPTNEEVTQKIKKRQNGNPFVVSTNKKCLIDFKLEEKQKKAVEIFVNCSFSASVKANETVYNGISAIFVANDLLKKGFKVKITAVFSGKFTNINPNNYNFLLLPVKNYDEPLDINTIAFVTSDARFYRFNYFKAICWIYDQQRLKIQPNLGGVINDINIVANSIETVYLPNSNKFVSDTRLYFGGARSETGCITEIDKAIEILNKNYGNENN